MKPSTLIVTVQDIANVMSQPVLFRKNIVKYWLIYMPQSDGICAMIVHLELFELYGCGIYQFVTEIGHILQFD